MVAFEGHHVTNLGQGKVETKEVNQPQIGGSIDAIRKMVKDSKKKLNELQKTIKSVDYSSSRLTSQYDKAIGEVNETFNFYTSMLAERKMEVTKEIDKLEQMVTFTEKLLQSASTKDVLLFQTSLETR